LFCISRTAWTRSRCFLRQFHSYLFTINRNQTITIIFFFSM